MLFSRLSFFLIVIPVAFWACSGESITEFHIEEAVITPVENTVLPEIENADSTEKVDSSKVVENVDSSTVENKVPSIENLEIPHYDAVEFPSAERVGPVSQYGQLMSGKNSEGKGRVFGSCKGVADGAEVQVRGMSLYWSLLPQATMFYSDAGISTMVKDMKIELIRAAIGTEEYWGGTRGFLLDPDAQRELIDSVVRAAVKNDIYVIIDWHSHNAHEQLEDAALFFAEMAQKYGKYDNVIFEIFNEPKKISWAEIKNYADNVVSVIRRFSDNLILVGNPSWDQTPNLVIGNEVDDPKHNVAYTFHYYANSHLIVTQGRRGLQAINAGLSLFVSEWGTGGANGGGVPNLERNDEWQDWVNENKLSSANWSASKINEGTAAFLSESTVNSLVYSEAGELVKKYLSTNPDSYTACAD